MHVYGWPINARLAEYNWNSRRAGRQGDRKQVEEPSRKREAVRPPSEVSHNHSFAEVVKGQRMEPKGERKGAILTMSWRRNKQFLVNTEGSSFSVKVEIDPRSVSLSWLNRVLDLENFSLANIQSASVEDSQCSLDAEPQKGKRKGRDADKSQLLDAVWKSKSKHFSDKSRPKDNPISKSVRFQKSGVGNVPTDVDKGKQQWVRIPRPRPIPRSNRNAKVVIKDNPVQGTNRSQGEASTSSASDSNSDRS
ncbi:hypothetical protein Q3G72_035126 [Acer saccharum]|nr:hypothetical protein Q3G72_035126 [Acer saccharum]